MTNKPVIVCAACKNGDITLVGPRHFDRMMQEQMTRIVPAPKYYRDYEQGFIDQWGKFYTRKEAMVVTKENGQPLLRNDEWSGHDELFSENLY